jgi:hypothetical protein
MCSRVALSHSPASGPVKEVPPQSALPPAAHSSRSGVMAKKPGEAASEEAWPVATSSSASLSPSALS